MTPQEAVDFMNNLVLTTWVAQSQLADNLRWTDVAGSIPDGEVNWARITPRHNNAPLRSIGENKLYENDGILFIQLFCPVGSGGTMGYALSHALQQAFRQQRNSEIRFQNARINEVGTSGAFNQTNVLVDFNYDTTEN